MADEKEFLETIARIKQRNRQRAFFGHPEDIAPYLVYADWSEEQGECDMAELLRIQCEYANPHLDRAKRLEMCIKEMELVERLGGAGKLQGLRLSLTED